METLKIKFFFVNEPSACGKESYLVLMESTGEFGTICSYRVYDNNAFDVIPCLRDFATLVEAHNGQVAKARAVKEEAY